MEKLKKEIIDVLISKQIPAKVGSDGVYEPITCIDSESFEDVADKLIILFRAITDPENQPNQYGIKL